MEKASSDGLGSIPVRTINAEPPLPNTEVHISGEDEPSQPTGVGLQPWAKNVKIPQPFSSVQDESPTGNIGKSTFARLTGGLGLRLSPKSPPADNTNEGSTAGQPGFIGTITKGLVDSSKSAVKAVQIKARHVVSQNKRRYQVIRFSCYKVLCVQCLYLAFLTPHW